MLDSFLSLLEEGGGPWYHCVVMAKPFENADAKTLSALRFIMFDVDDTVTDGGRLTDAAYSAMWDLSRAGFRLVPVTGRPAGWCDMMLREWPVEAVICENGAFALYWEQKRVRTLLHPHAAKEPAPALEALRARVLAAVPGARLAGDQPFRIYDAAFDFAEDEPRLADETVRAVMRECEAAGARTKLSSIHVNAWFGDYDKLSMARLYFGRVHGIADPRDAVIFFGDSPNDEPMFSYFPMSCGVENVADYLGVMEHPPAYIARGRGGAGFAWASRIILEKTGGVTGQ